jgi:hypothetical protein
MFDTWIIHNLIRVLLGTSALEEGAMVADGEWSAQPGKGKTNKRKHRVREKEDVASTALRRKGTAIHR